MLDMHLPHGFRPPTATNISGTYAVGPLKISHPVGAVDTPEPQLIRA